VEEKKKASGGPAQGTFIGQPLPRRRKQDLPEERKLVTVMFADIAGFTALAETMDPEHLRDLINACFDQLVPVVTKYGGIVDKFIGDEIMAIFGVPIAHENDAERSLRASLEMQEALVEFNKAYGTDLGIQFGINTGLVIAGRIGARDRQDYSVMGDAVNLAARLQEASQRGEIWVGPDTYRLTKHLFAFKALGPLRIKGKTEPVPVYKLVDMRAQLAPLRGLEDRGISSPLVGRDDEVTALLSGLELLLAGQGGLVSIIAEAGVGKSRLIAEVRRKVTGRKILWLEGRALSFSQTISYWPFLEIIQADAGITVEDQEDERWAKMERRVNDLFPEETAEILPYLATLLALEVPGDLAERVKYLDGETMGRQVFRTTRRFFARLAQDCPLILIFEDMHWADHSSVLLLEHLLPLVREVPLLICGVGRPDPQSPAARLWEIAARDYSQCYMEIALAPLSPAESTRLIHNLLKTEDLSPRLREGILQKAEGNPFFLEEVLRELIDIGALVRDKITGRWQATAQVEQITIPDTLQGVIMARIDRLDEEVKQVLKLAAVIGRIFFYRVLQGVAEAEREMDRYLAALQNLELVRERSRIPELEYIFKHALVQEAAYESILLQRRRQLHRRVGECIEVLFADRLDDFYGLLAYHYTRAEEWEKAQDYLFKAGDQAGKMAADAEALAHYRQALAAYGRAFGDSWDPLQRAVLERKMGEALFRRGEHSQAREYLQRALVSLGSPYPTSHRGVRIEIVKQLLRQAAHRLLPSLFWRNLPDRTAEERCRIYSVMAWMDYFMDPERLVLDSLLELNLAEKSDLPGQVVLASMGVGLAWDAIPGPRLARYYHSRAVGLAERIQQPVALGQAYFGLGLHEHHTLGNWESAHKYYRRAATAYWEAGHLRRWAGVNMAASLLWPRGNVITNLNLGQEVLQISQDAADFQAIGWGLFMTALPLDQSGALDEAVANLQRAIELLKGVPDYQVIVFASGLLARCYLRQGKVRQALTTLEESYQLIKKYHLRGFSCVPVWITFAQTYLAIAEKGPEPQRAADLKRAKRACRVALKQVKFDRGSLPAAYRMQGTYAWLKNRPNTAKKRWHKSLEMAEGMGARYELGLTNLEMGKFMEDPVYLNRAEEIFGEIGAKFDHAQAQKLLERIAH